MCNINYYMVWSVKYRRKILDPEIEEYLQELVQQISEDKGITGRKLFERFLEIRNQLWNHSYYVDTGSHDCLKRGEECCCHTKHR